jgi:hypothetical protein
MADLAKVYVVIEVDETDIGKVRVGQPVTITVEAYTDQPFEGEVLKIAPQGKVVQNVTTFEVTTELKNVGSRQRVSGGPGGGRRQWGGDSPPMSGGGQRQGGRGDFRPGAGGERAGGESITPEQRERWMAMRRQREGGDSTNAPPRAAPSETPQVKPQGAEGSAGKASGGSSDPWDAFLDNLEGTQKPVQQPEEEKTTPFLKPGMNATVEIQLANKQGVLLLPNEAILSFGDRKLVRVIGADGQPGRPQPITAGVSGFDKTEVISGLEEGQTVALGSFQRPGGGGGNQPWQQMMRNPASTMQRMQGVGPGGRMPGGGGGGAGGRR